MKKFVAVIAILSALAIVAYSSYRAGIRHAIEASVIWTVECYDPMNPEENARPDGTDQTVWIELDGDLYEHGMYQG